MKISRLCFGTLTLGPLQKNMSPRAAGELMYYAVQRGINFFDTAELYETYAHIRELLRLVNREEIVISTKSYAYDEITAKRSVDIALAQMETDYLDFFLLHEQESIHTLRGHMEALEYLARLKDKGVIKKLGISTHNIGAIVAAKYFDEIEVLHPIVNIKGIGIVDGSIDEMIKAISDFKSKDKIVYGMKVLGGGALICEYLKAMRFALSLETLDSIAIGMQSKEEIDCNVDLVMTGKYDIDLAKRISNYNRNIIIHAWCVGCGKCVEVCHQGAIRVLSSKASVDKQKCITCGYCVATCKDMCIKII